MKSVFSVGNSKLGKNTLIFNITSGTDCPSLKLGLCKIGKYCYCLKAEKLYKQVLPYRENQTTFWDSTEVVDIYELFKKRITNRKLKTPITRFRFSESGDFRNQDDVNKMYKLCKLLKGLGLTCYGYTARKDLDFSKLKKVATVMGSSFMISNEFRYIPKNKKFYGKYVCKGNCKLCNYCVTLKGKIIGVNHH